MFAERCLQALFQYPYSECGVQLQEFLRYHLGLYKHLKSTSLLGPSPGTWIRFHSRTHQFSNQTFSLDRLLLWLQKAALPFCLFSHAFNWIPCQFMGITVDLFYMIRRQAFKYMLCIKYHLYSAGKEKHFWSNLTDSGF